MTIPRHQSLMVIPQPTADNKARKLWNWATLGNVQSREGAI